MSYLIRRQVSHELIIKLSQICVAVFLVFFLLVPSSNSIAAEISHNSIEKVATTFASGTFPGVSVKSVYALKLADGKVIGYVANLSPKGFVVLSGDTDIYPVILYSNNNNFDSVSSNENIGLDLVKWDLEARERAIAAKPHLLSNTISRNNLAWHDLSSGAALSEPFGVQQVYGPLLTSTWNQNGIYGQYCPTDPKTGGASLVGCVATAASQILNYWKFPKSMTFSNQDAYTSRGVDGTIAIPGDASTYNFPTFATLNQQLSTIRYDGSQTEIGYFCFGVGVKLRMNYSSVGSGTYQSAAFYRDLGYGSENSGPWQSSYPDVIQNIEQGWPVQVAIYSTSGEGHSVVFDGFDQSNSSFHVNMGWGGEDNAWYIPPALNTPYINFTIMGNVVYNICPDPGWSQWGADQGNTDRASYSIPNNDSTKWSVQTDANHDFQGLIVTQGAEVVASCTPNVLNSTDHPVIMEIGPDGVLKSEITIKNENIAVSSPVRNESGEIFVSTGTGKIYEINASDSTANLIFQDPNSGQFYSALKIDTDGLLYANTGSNLYCIDSTGKALWHVTAPSGCIFPPSATPAIDVQRNMVYLAYYNSSAKTSVLLTIDRLNGSILARTTFSNISSPMYTVSTVSVANNGKVYFGCSTGLYQLDPTNLFSLSELYNNNYGLIVNPPAIGKNGSLYFSCWKNSSEYDVFSLDPVSDNINWSIPFSAAELGTYGSISNIYTDNDGHVCVTLKYQSNSQEYFTLYTYKDNGSSANLLWKKNIGDWGGFVAFGPDNTMYYSNGNSVTAMAELPQGQSAFANYTNDNPPASPSYSSPSDEMTNSDTTLTFNWSCTDPDGNPLRYTFYLGASAQMLNEYYADTNTTSITIHGLQPDTTYLWSVAATDGQATTHGAIWSFKVESITPKPVLVVPTLIYPPADSANIPRRVPFSWNSSPNATSYGLQVATGTSFSSVVVDTTVPDTMVRLSSPLDSTMQYYWRVRAMGTNDTTQFTTGYAFTTGTGILAVEQGPGIPRAYALYQNYPNPFNPTTTIRFDLKETSLVTLEVYNVLGERIFKEDYGTMYGGTYSKVVNLSSFASGVYFYRIVAVGPDGVRFVAVKKLMLMK